MHFEHDKIVPSAYLFHEKILILSVRGSSYFTWLWNFATRKTTVGFRDSSLKTCQSQYSKYFDYQVSDVARTDAKMNKQCGSGGAYGKICTWFYKEDEFNKTESTLAKKRCFPFLSGCGNWIGMFQSLKREKTKPSRLPTCQGWYDGIMLSNRKCHRRIQWQIFNIHGQSQRQNLIYSCSNELSFTWLDQSGYIPMSQSLFRSE